MNPEADVLSGDPAVDQSSINNDSTGRPALFPSQVTWKQIMQIDADPDEEVEESLKVMTTAGSNDEDQSESREVRLTAVRHTQTVRNAMMSNANIRWEWETRIPLTSTDASGNSRIFNESLAKSGGNGGDEDAYMAFKWSTPITDEGRSKATEKGKQLQGLLSAFDAIVSSTCPSTKETAFALVGAQQEDHTYQPGPPEKRSVTTGDGRVIPMISLDEARELRSGEDIGDRGEAVNSAINELISDGARNVVFIGHQFYLDQYLAPIERDCYKAGVDLDYNPYFANLEARSYSGTLPVSQVIDPTEA